MAKGNPIVGLAHVVVSQQEMLEKANEQIEGGGRMTIKERAHQYGCKAAGGWYKGGIRGAVYEAHHDIYIEVATEQQKIDIDKACEEFNTFVDNVMSQKFEPSWCAAAKIRFRQNLEE